MAKVYATWNPSDKSVNVTLSGGNLIVEAIANYHSVRSTVGVSSGKWYWEVTITSGLDALTGVGKSTASLIKYAGYDINGYGYYGYDGKLYNNSTSTGSNSTYTTGDIVGIALDMDSGTVKFYKNNTLQGSSYPGLTGTFYAMTSPYISVTQTANFGATAMAYIAPSGYNQGLYSGEDSNIASITRSITQGSDDAGYLFEMAKKTWQTSATSIYSDYNYDTNSIIGRFQNITIPKGAIITSTILGYTIDVTRNIQHRQDPFSPAIDSTGFNFRGVLLDNVSTFSDGASNSFNPTKTIASVTNTVSMSVVKDTKYYSPNLNSVVQEIINQSGWTSGNSLALFFQSEPYPDYQGGLFSIYSYDGSPSNAMTLDIEYIIATAPTTTGIQSMTGVQSITF